MMAYFTDAYMGYSTSMSQYVKYNEAYVIKFLKTKNNAFGKRTFAICELLASNGLQSKLTN